MAKFNVKSELSSILALRPSVVAIILNNRFSLALCPLLSSLPFRLLKPTNVKACPANEIPRSKIAFIRQFFPKQLFPKKLLSNRNDCVYFARRRGNGGRPNGRSASFLRGESPTLAREALLRMPLDGIKKGQGRPAAGFERRVDGRRRFRRRVGTGQAER